MNIVSNDVWRLMNFPRENSCENENSCTDPKKKGQGCSGQGPMATTWSWSNLQNHTTLCLEFFSADEQEAIKGRESAQDNVAEGYEKQLKEFTCYDCVDNDKVNDPELSTKCEWAFDGYNKQGDCLAAK